MILDYFTIWALKKGWRDKIEGGTVKEIRTADSAVLLNIEGNYQWKDTHLFEISLEEEFPRTICHGKAFDGAERFLPVPDDKPGFSSLLKTELTGKRLWGITATPEVGILCLNFKAVHRPGESDFSPSYRNLLIDLREASRNIVLTDNKWLVLGSFSPAGDSDMARRDEDGGLHIEDKLIRRKENPFTLSQEEITEILLASPLPLAEAITGAFPRFSMTTAEQLVLGSHLLPNEPLAGQEIRNPRALPTAIHDLADIADRWYQPSVLYLNNQPVAFSGSSWNFIGPASRPGGRIKKYKSADDMLEAWIASSPVR